MIYLWINFINLISLRDENASSNCYWWWGFW
jgi:hypothetical protein